MQPISPNNIWWGIVLSLMILPGLSGQEMPAMLFVKSESQIAGLNVEFLLSSPLQREDISGWIEQENWFIINFYNIIKPNPGIFNDVVLYPILDVQQAWSNNSLQVSIQTAQKIGASDIVFHNEDKRIIIALTYKDFIESKEINPSYVIPNPNEAKKIQHPLSWKDARERTTLEILCDTDGLPIYVDNQLVGHSPLVHSVDVLPGWHKVGYFPKDYSGDYNSRTPEEKMLRDILIMGRMDVFVEEGKHEIIVLNYQSLDEDVIDYNNRFKTSATAGFSLFLLMIFLMSWGLA